MDGPADLRMKRIPLNHGTGRIPALGFGTSIPDAAVTINCDQRRNGSRIFDTSIARNCIQTRQRLNTVVSTGVPGFIPKGG